MGRARLARASLRRAARPLPAEAARVHRIGLQDCYVQSGPNDALLDIYGLSGVRVAEQVRAILSTEGVRS